jgi:lysophospholipase L1-like esterase
MRSIALLLVSCCVGLSPAADPGELAPGKPIEYRELAIYPDRWEKQQVSTMMLPWEGKHVVFLTTKPDFDHTIMGRLVTRLDSGWELYEQLTGRTPRPHKRLKDKTPFAAVPKGGLSCGVGCGYVGATGVELGKFYNVDYQMLKSNPRSMPHYMFYEMGRNFYTFGDRHSLFVTGFAVYMRYVCMDTLGCDDPDTRVKQTIEQAEEIYAKSDVSFLSAFTNLGQGEKANRLKGADGKALVPSDQPVIYATAMLKLARDCGGNKWLGQFYRHLAACPAVEPKTEEAALRQVMNWFVAASCAAGTDLTPTFVDRWRMPMTPAARQLCAEINWQDKNIDAGAIVRQLTSLPAEAEGVAFLWTGKGGDGQWGTKENWHPSSGVPGSGDNVIFPEIHADVEITLAADQAARSITFDPVNPFAYTLKGKSITIDDGGTVHFRALKTGLKFKQSAVQEIHCDLRLAGKATIGNDNRWYLGLERLNISGRIHGSQAITITSEGGGCVGFSGDNRTFSGPLIIGNGQFILYSPEGLGTCRDTIVMNSGRFSVMRWSMSRDFLIAGNASWTAGLSAGPHTGTITVQEGATWTYGTGNNTSIMHGTIAGAGDMVIKCGHGTTFAGTSPNTLSGTYTVTGGLTTLARTAGVNVVSGPLVLSGKPTLRWGADEQVADKSPVSLVGDAVVMDLNGHRETMGTLDLQGYAFIECGDGNNILQLVDSRAVPWNTEKELVVRNWRGSKTGGGQDRIIFGDSAEALTPTQLACIGFLHPAGFPEGMYSAVLLASGEIVPGKPVRPIDPPYNLSDEAKTQRRQVYEVPGRANLSGKDTPLKRGMKISFYGDSITWNRSYLSKIEKALKEGEGSKSLAVKLINHGVNGGGALTLRDGDEGKAHFGNTQPRPFAETVAEESPDVVVIYIGVNDIWWRKTSPADFEAALNDLVASAKRAKARVVLATLALWGDNPLPDNRNNVKCDQYADITRRVAATSNVVLADLRKACMAYLMNNNGRLRLNGSLAFADKGILSGDGVHPNGNGGDLIADLICQGICEALSRP